MISLTRTFFSTLFLFFLIFGIPSANIFRIPSDSFSGVSSAWAGEEEEESLLDRLSEKISIRLVYKNFSHFHAGSPRDERVRNEGIVRLDFRTSVTDFARIVLIPSFRVDDNELTSGIIDDLEDDDKKRNIFTIEEGYGEFLIGDLTLSAGKRIYGWGTGDFRNPTDYINPRDFTDIVDSEKIGVPSASIHYQFGEFGAELVIIPFFTPARIPQPDSRWFPSDPEESEIPLEYVSIRRERPEEDPENIQYAVRAAATLVGWDFSLYFYDGFQTTPRATLDFVEDIYIPPNLIISRPVVSLVYYRVTAVGADFSTTFGDLELHGELSQVFTHGDKDDSYLQYIIGGNYHWYEIISDHDLALIVEYTGEWVNDEADNPSLLETGEGGRVFTNTLFVKANYQWGEDLELRFSSVFNFDGKDNLYLQPSAKYILWKTLKLTLGFDLFFGDKKTFFGRYRENDRFFLFLEYTF